MAKLVIEGWERKFIQCLVADKPLPTIFPHPDDVLVDMRTGEVRILGPRSKEEFSYLKSLLSDRETCVQLIAEREAVYTEEWALLEEEIAPYEAEIRAKLAADGDRWREVLIEDGFYDPETFHRECEEDRAYWRGRLAEIDQQFEVLGWKRRDARDVMRKTYAAWLERRKEKEREEQKRASKDGDSVVLPHDS